MEETEGDIISDSIWMFGDIHTCHEASSDGFFNYVPPKESHPSHQIKLRLYLNTSKVLPGFPNFVWNSGVIMADLIFNGRLPVQGKSILELGAGAGLTSIAAALHDAKIVVATDYDDPNIITNLRNNMSLNLSPEILSKAIAMGHSWGTDPLPVLKALHKMEQKSSYFDIILLADVLWNEENFKILLNSCDGLSDKHTAIYLAYADYQTANVNYFFLN